MKLLRKITLVAVSLLTLNMSVNASDHADPIALTNLAEGITGLFAFPKGDDLIVILTVRRSLTSPPPYRFGDRDFTIYMDLDADISFDSAENNARYGGTVNKPDQIYPEIAIRFRLDENGQPQAGFPKFEGTKELRGYQDIPVDVGVYDDPFIFPRFFKMNVVAMSLKIPMSAFPAGQKDMLLWATTRDDGDLVDHVGRSNRTQQARFDFLNRLTPDKQVPDIQWRRDGGVTIQNGLAELMSHFQPVGALSGLYEYIFEIRPYDIHPDVMIYSTKREPGYPNGRRLEDDVAGLTCDQGECILQELAFIEGGWPRQTVNDKPFQADFPYLAEPWPDHPEHDHPERFAIIFWSLVIGLLVLFILYNRRKADLAEIPYVPPHSTGF